MVQISRTNLFGKLNPLLFKSIESATVFCKMRGNPYVELVHWIHQLLQLEDSDLRRIIKRFNLEPVRLAADITRTLDELPRGSTSISDLSAHVEEATERGWIVGTLIFNELQVRSGYLLLGVLMHPNLKNALTGISKEFARIDADALADQFKAIVGDSPENGMMARDGFFQPTEPEAPVRPEDTANAIFINYRRADSAYACGRIYDRLATWFGRGAVYKDVDSMMLGTRDFDAELERTLAQMRFFLAVIGKNWLDARVDDRRRLDDPKDYVRREIEIALATDAQIIPVLLDGMEMPAEESLPAEIAAISKIHALEIRRDPDFENDMEKLTAHIRAHL